MSAGVESEAAGLYVTSVVCGYVSCRMCVYETICLQDGGSTLLRHIGTTAQGITVCHAPEYFELPCSLSAMMLIMTMDISLAG
jgi:hypothetical protein